MRTTYDEVIQYEVEVITEGPLHVGDASLDRFSILKDERGLPMVQGSSLAGSFREIASGLYSAKAVDELFGSLRDQGGRTSRVIFSDMRCKYASASERLEIRPRLRIDAKTGTSATKDGGGQKFDMEYLGKGASLTFRLHLLLVQGEERSLEACAIVERALGALHGGAIRLGGIKSSGCGRFRIATVKKQRWNLLNANERTAWLLREPGVAQDLELDPVSAPAELLLMARSSGGLLVKSHAEYSKNSPDAVQMRNAEGSPIIPGTTLKGILRAQVERISGLTGDPDAVARIFGSKDDDNASPGIAIFEDSVLEKPSVNAAQSRIRVDRFTGGVRTGALFSEETVSGNLIFHIRLLKIGYAKKDLAMLLLALRDIGNGWTSVGSGEGIGRGRLDGTRLEARVDGETVFSMSWTEGQPDIQKGSPWVESCIEELWKGAAR